MVEAVSTSRPLALNTRRILAGLDEAGLGPILGPLVIGGVALEGPAGTDPWRLLKKLVCRSKASRTKIRVADSKKVHQGAHKLEQIERTALSFFGAFWGEVPATVHDLLGAVGADVARLQRCPWYTGLDLALPCANDRKAIELLAYRLGREVGLVGMRLLRLAVRVVDVEEWNALIVATDNKSDAHFSAYADVLGELFAAVDGHDAAGAAHIVADRCGGRWHYGKVLSERWPRARIDVVGEREARSDYVVGMGDRHIQLTFAEKADDRAFPTALASCLAKYTREVMLAVMNGWFHQQRPDLRPTAGYYTDGHRFLDDVRGMPDVPWDRLVRSR
jgi:ribonuclease HII